jgi:tetratricopeptide (TPR) repeat protein
MSRTFAIARLALVAVLAGALLACGGAEDRKAGHLDRGEALLAEGSYEKARVEFKNVLQIDPKDVRGRVGLARAHEGLQEWREAVGHYRAAAEQDATNVEARVRLARIYLLGKARDPAGEVIEEALALDPKNVEALALRATLRAEKGDVDGALEDIDAVQALEPKNVQALGLLAALYASAGDRDRAAVTLEEALAAAPDNVAVRVRLASLYIERGDHERGIALYRELTELEPEDLGHQVRLAALYVALKRLDEGERVLREAVAKRPDDLRAKIALIELLTTQRGREAAVREVQGLIEASPDSHELRFALAALFEAGGEAEAAKQVFRTVLARAGTAPAGLQARNRLARILASQQQTDEALALVAEVLEANPKDEDALVLRGDVALARGQAPGAIADYRAALKGRPESADLLVLLARAHTANKEPQLAEESLRKAVAAEPRNTRGWLELAQFLAQAGRTDAAIEQLDLALEGLPSNYRLVEAKARLLLAKEDWDGALAQAKALEESHPEKGIGAYLMGLAHQGKGDHAAAAAALERATALAPRAAEPLTAWVRSLLVSGQAEKALTELEALTAAQPDNALAWNLKGEVLLVQGRHAEAEALFEKALTLAPTSTALYRNLAIAGMGSGDQEATVEALRRGVQATEGRSSSLRFQLAGLYEQLGRYEEAIAENEAMLKQDPGSLAVANNLAMLLASYRTDPESLARARTLAARLEGSEVAPFLDTLGWVQYRSGDLEAARATLEKAAGRAPGLAIIQYHLGAVYHALGDPARAKEHLERAATTSERYPGLDEARALLKTLR